MTARVALVTGGTGFIGTALVQQLLAAGHSVTVKPISARLKADSARPACASGKTAPIAGWHLKSSFSCRLRWRFASGS